MKINTRNAERVMQNLTKLVQTDSQVREALDEWLDEMLNADAFGTEGQLDPRGDHRE